MVNRREFLQGLAGLTAGLTLGDTASGQAASTPASTHATGPAPAPTGSDALGPLLPQRWLGRTGVAVTMLGLGGDHLGQIAVRDEKAAQETIETAIAGGVRFFDNAESYGKPPGTAEEAYGRLLTPKYRDHIFLMSKTYIRDENAKPVAEAEFGQLSKRHLEGTLRRLKTDHLDLWQIHSIKSIEDVEARIANGVLDTLLEAQRQGKTRFIGFTGHHLPEANLRMIERMKQHGEVLQTCQMPINVLDPNYLSFIDGVLPALVERRYGVLAMKTLGGGNFVVKPEEAKRHPDWKAIVPDRVSLQEAVHFVWSLPVSCLVSGTDSAAQFKEMIGLARSFAAMSEARRKELVAKVADLAGDKNPKQHIEWYKPRATATTKAGGE